MGLQASKRMSELSSEYMQQVDILTREKEAVRARAEAAEEEARQLAAVMHAHGFGTPHPTERIGGGGRVHGWSLDNVLGDEAGDGGGSGGSGGGMVTPASGPAALLFASPIVTDCPLDCISSPAVQGHQGAGGGGGGGGGECRDGVGRFRGSDGGSVGSDNDPDDDDFDFAVGFSGCVGTHSASTAALSNNLACITSAASTAADWLGGADVASNGQLEANAAETRAYLRMSTTSSDSLTASMLASCAAQVIQSVAAAPEEVTPPRDDGGGSGGRLVSASHTRRWQAEVAGVDALCAALTPSGAAVEGAAAVAMASLDHPTLVAEAANLVAANVRLERERRALVARLERAEAAAAAATAASCLTTAAASAPPAWAVTPASDRASGSGNAGGVLALTPPEAHDVMDEQAAEMVAMATCTGQTLQLPSSTLDIAAEMSLSPASTSYRHAYPATPGATVGVPAMLLAASAPGILLTPGGNAAVVATSGWTTGDGGNINASQHQLSTTQPISGSGGAEADAVTHHWLSEPPPVSWDMQGTEFAVSQMSEALERVQAAASEVASLIDPAFHESDDLRGSGGSLGGSGSGSRTSGVGGKVNRAARHKQRAGVDPAAGERRRRAHALALEASAAAALASMQREHLVEVRALEHLETPKFITP